jgi:hypothetical protein
MTDVAWFSHWASCISDSDDKLHGNSRGGRKKPNLAKSPTGLFLTADVNSKFNAMLCRGLENSLSEQHGRNKAWARRGVVN